jgi:hypothetical protein
VNRRGYILVCLEEETYSPVSYIRLIAHLEQLAHRYAGRVVILPREREVALEKLPGASLMIMARNRTEASYDVAQRAAELKVPILYDLDDYVWKYPDYSKVARYREIFTDEIIGLNACLTTPSENLRKEILHHYPKKDVRIIANPGNVWSGSGRKFVPCVMANSDFFRIPEMKEQFFRALRDAAQACDQAILLYYLSNDPPEFYTDDPHLRVVWVGFRSYSSYKQLLDHLKPELAFVLLREETFSQFKSVVKFAEYGCAGTLGIYSKVEPYRDFIRDGENGFLAENTYEDWKRAVTRALSVSSVEKDHIMQRIDEHIREHFDFATLHPRFVDIITAMARPDAPSSSYAGSDVLPARGEFTFREAYGYTCWKLYHDPESSPAIAEENRRLRAELDAIKQTTLHRLGQWIARIKNRWAG